MKAHCLFEQSGTFKNQFKALGVEAIDYDIRNDYGETDRVIDLFSEIRGGYEGKTSLFNEISKDDIIMAFFPCTRFEAQILLSFRGEQYQMTNYTDEQKLETDLKLHSELSENYEIITKLAIICLRKGFKLVIENPFNDQHYLTRYWCMKPKIKDMDRRMDGDYYKKPTQYWFINFEPKQNLVFESLDYVKPRTIENVVNEESKKREIIRSEIHPQYARRFIKKYLLDSEVQI